MTAAGILAANGYLTGALPEDEKEKNTLPPGWQPWSVKIPNPNGDGYSYVKYSQLGAPGMPMALAAIGMEQIKRGKTPDPVRMVQSLGKYTIDQTMLQGFKSILNGIEQPERFGENLLESLVSPSVPLSGLQRQIARSTGMADRDPEGALQALEAQTIATPLHVSVADDQRFYAIGQMGLAWRLGIAPEQIQVAQACPPSGTCLVIEADGTWHWRGATR